MRDRAQSALKARQRWYHSKRLQTVGDALDRPGPDEPRDTLRICLGGQGIDPDSYAFSFYVTGLNVKTPRLPVELVWRIIELAGDQRLRQSCAKTCALVCREWSSVARHCTVDRISLLESSRKCWHKIFRHWHEDALDALRSRDGIVLPVRHLELIMAPLGRETHATGLLSWLYCMSTLRSIKFRQAPFDSQAAIERVTDSSMLTVMRIWSQMTLNAGVEELSIVSESNTEPFSFHRVLENDLFQGRAGLRSFEGRHIEILNLFEVLSSLFSSCPLLEKLVLVRVEGKEWVGKSPVGENTGMAAKLRHLELRGSIVSKLLPAFLSPPASPALSYLRLSASTEDWLDMSLRVRDASNTSAQQSLASLCNKARQVVLKADVFLATVYPLLKSCSVTLRLHVDEGLALNDLEVVKKNAFKLPVALIKPCPAKTNWGCNGDGLATSERVAQAAKKLKGASLRWVKATEEDLLD